jgi:hypothetical protein
MRGEQCCDNFCTLSATQQNNSVAEVEIHTLAR